MMNVPLIVKFLGIAIISSILTALVGAFGFIGISSLDDDINVISNSIIPSVVSIYQVKEGISVVRRVEQSMQLPEYNTPEEIALRSKELAAAWENTRKGIKAYESNAMDAKEKAIWAEFKSFLAQFESANSEATQFIVNGKRDEAMKISTTKGRENFRSLFAKLTELVDYNVKEANSTSSESKSKAAQSKRSMVISVVACLLISSFLVVFLSRIVVNGIKTVVSFALKVSEGKLDEELMLRQKDEVGQLADSLRTMVSRLKDKINEANEQSRLAELRTEEAAKATAAAEEAQKKAERAKAEGMLQAANQLQQVVEIVTSASEELSAQIDESTRGAEEQSQRTGETATAMEEMNASVLEVAKNASHAADTADKAKQKAMGGASVVEKVVHEMAEVQKQALNMKNDMTSLGQQAQGIGQIMNVISDIADQTNLLALNAAIEAARAGEAGRGFAVVADEVRKLAEKTMTATKEVGDAIHGIQDGTRKNIENVDRTVQQIDQATELAGKSGEALEEIVSLVDITTDQVRSIATASEQQSAASEEINRSVEEVNRISMETSSLMRESAHAVGELAQQSQVLNGLIQEMQEQGGAGTRSLTA
jgi:methyl-accepting chemotaxis protein